MPIAVSCAGDGATDVDAVVSRPVSGVLTDVGMVSNWAAGRPTVAPGFTFQLGLCDPTGSVSGNHSGLFAGEGNSITTSLRSVIIGGGPEPPLIGPNAITAAVAATDSSGILAGAGNTISGGIACAIVGGAANTIAVTGVGGGVSAIIASVSSSVTSTAAAAIATSSSAITGGASGGSAIIGGGSHTISGSDCGVFAGTGHIITMFSAACAIVGGASHLIASSGPNNSMIGGSSNLISGAGAGGSVIGGSGNIVSADAGTVIGGSTNSAVAGSPRSAVLGGMSNIVGGIGGGDDSVILGGTLNVIGGLAVADESVILGGISSTVDAPESVAVCSGVVPSSATPRQFAHGTGSADPVGFRGSVPIPAPVLAALPAPTGVPGLDAYLASVDAAFKTQGLAV